MRRISVPLGERSYDVYVGYDVLDQLPGALLQLDLKGKAMVVTNPRINSLYGDLLCRRMREAGFETLAVEIPDGEVYKSLETAHTLYDSLVTHGFERRSLIVALGGGVVGDLAGFVAATFMRGVPYVQVPTTLLAQVDSSVGGKVAVNHSKGKNLIGTFYQPSLVWIDTKTLETLPKRQFFSGLAEVTKYGVVADEQLFRYSEDNAWRLKGLNQEVLQEVIARSCSIKAKIVSCDEREGGLRTILNYGHTVGHALETVTNYEFYTHGEAVAIGMTSSMMISQRMGLTAGEESHRQQRLLEAFNLPTAIRGDIELDALLQTLRRDKKVLNGRIRFVLPKAIGQVLVTDQVHTEILQEVLEEQARAGHLLGRQMS
jgi:3-dehydroquinate synthase